LDLAATRDADSNYETRECLIAPVQGRHRVRPVTPFRFRKDLKKPPTAVGGIVGGCVSGVEGDLKEPPTAVGGIVRVR